MNLLGQILPDSPFGRVLTDLASQSDTILEVGTWKGGGSTRCIVEGIWKSNANFVTIEADIEEHRTFVKAIPEEWTGLNIFPQYGVFHRGILPLSLHPTKDNPQVRECWEFEFQAIHKAPIKPALPYDLILLDGGEFTSFGDFMVLWPFAQRWIALDDTNPMKALKNTLTRNTLYEMGWKVLRDVMGDRYGWAVFEKP